MHNLIGMAKRHLRAKPVGLREDTRPAQGKVKHTRNYKEIKKKRFRWITSMYVLFTCHDDVYNLRKWDLPLLIRIIQITLFRHCGCLLYRREKKVDVRGCLRLGVSSPFKAYV